MQSVYRCQVLVAAALFALTANAYASSSWVPEHNVEIIAGANPGGSADRTARTVQKVIQDRSLVEAPTVVLNKPGAGGAIGWAYLNQHADDGHFIAIATPPLLTNYITGKSKLNYSDLTPLAQLYGEYFVFVVRPDSPIKTGKDLVARLKGEPSSIPIAVASSGGANHISVGLVARQAGIDVKKLKIVVFNSGGATLTALLGGHVQLVAANPASAARLIKAGKVRAIAVAAERRMAGIYADIPTWRELGVDAVLMTWRGVVGPRGLQPSQVAYWEQVFKRVTQSEEWKESAKRNHWQENYLNSAESRNFLAAQHALLKSVLSDLGLAK